jgi:hypothetical protein
MSLSYLEMRAQQEKAAAIEDPEERQAILDALLNGTYSAEADEEPLDDDTEDEEKSKSKAKSTSSKK